MKIGLVTVLFKSDDVLYDFYKSISNQTYENYLLVLVDNSPSLQTKKLINHLNTQFNISPLHIEMDSNIGVAAANNVGIKAAINNDCAGIIVLNNDIVFTQSNCFQQLINLSEKYSLIAPKILYHQTNKIWYAGGKFRRWFGFVKHYGNGKPNDSKYNFSKYTSYAPTCFVYIKKEVFDAVGLMDEKYFVYVDDTDFMYRAYLKGYKLWYEAALVVEHKVSQSTGGLMTDFSLYYDTRNKIYFGRKFNSLLLQITSNFFISVLAFVFATKQKRLSALTKVKQAIVDGYKMKVD